MQIKEGEALVVYVDPDGTITMGPLSTRRIPEYTDEDLAMFEEEDKMTPELQARVDAFLKKRR